MTPRASSTSNRSTGTSAASSSPENKVASEEQKARDTDARRILEAELRKEEAALESLKKDFNNGQPERRGDERNYQKYLDRVNEMKAALTRKEADVASLRRELSKFGGGGAK
jgi:chromosome segregation ATPase